VRPRPQAEDVEQLRTPGGHSLPSAGPGERRQGQSLPVLGQLRHPGPFQVREAVFRSVEPWLHHIQFQHQAGLSTLDPPININRMAEQSPLPPGMLLQIVLLQGWWRAHQMG